jgi:precorrin-2 dehydrogenase/sirohydrochlorin ferrochelatase
MMFYPVYLNLKNKQVIVIGGGEVAERKIESLLETGAVIRVISPQVTSGIHVLAEQKRIELHVRAYSSSDCDGATLILSATNDPEVSEQAFRDAATAGAWINTADEPQLCDFIMPAVVRRGAVTIAISTGGTSPGLAARLRRKIAGIVGPEYGQLTELLSQARPEIRKRVRDARARKALHERILDSDIIERLRQNDTAGAERRLREIIGS